jgi:hypothetical protein
MDIEDEDEDENVRDISRAEFNLDSDSEDSAPDMNQHQFETALDSDPDGIFFFPFLITAFSRLPPKLFPPTPFINFYFESHLPSRVRCPTRDFGSRSQGYSFR